MTKPLSPAEQVLLSLDVIDDLARVLASPDLSREERREYEEASEAARARLEEARAELAMGEAA